VFEEGDEFHSAIFEDGETFRRVDFSAEAWSGPPDGCFCHYKTRVPPSRKKARPLLVGNEALEAFFRRLAGEGDPLRIGFRFVLALLLMRKRLLRYDGTRNRDGREVWDMTLLRDQSRHEVVHPHLSDDEVSAVSRELMVILHGDVQADLAAHDGGGDEAMDGGGDEATDGADGAGGGGDEAMGGEDDAMHDGDEAAGRGDDEIRGGGCDEDGSAAEL